MSLIRLFAVLPFALAATACAVQPKYEWGNYDRSLYSYYKDSTSAAEHMAELERIVANAETADRKVAPGIHAEYGYLLLQKNRTSDALAQFEMEKAKWPESAQFMNIMIKAASARSNQMASQE